MMKQYHEMKQKAKDAVLLFRLGDFYEMFYEDAKIASSVLDIALTARDGGQSGKYPMCGFPHHAQAAYIPKLVEAGHKVAVCEQVEDPKQSKGIVKRDIVKMITPGTVMDENLLTASQSNYLASLNKVKNVYGLALVELSTGEFKVVEINNDHDLFSELFRVRPKEFVLAQSISENKEFMEKLSITVDAAVNTLEDWQFEANSAQDKLQQFLHIFSLEGYGIADHSPVIGAAGAALTFLEQNIITALEHISGISCYSLYDYMVIDPISQRNLELLEPIRHDSKSKTLFSIIDRTQTPMGARLLKQWITSPMIDIEMIKQRHNAVGELTAHQDILNELDSLLKRVRDLERLIARCSVNQMSPKDCIALKESLQQIPKLKEELSKCSSEFLIDRYHKMQELPQLVYLIENALVDDPPVSIKDGGVFKKGFNDELDKIRDIGKNGKKWMADLQAQEIQRTGIKSLKVRYNKVFGYYIEITKSNLDMTPDNYIRKQTLANCERFITTELKEIESQVLNAEDRMKEIELELFKELRENLMTFTRAIQETAKSIAKLDCITSLSKTALAYGYTKPTVTSDDLIEITNGRHPVVEAMLPKGEFVPNDLLIDTESNQLLIITGPNMAGKSTFIRQTALLVVLAQMGSFIPADYATIGVVDRIFTRVGASDELAKGQSTFMVEMIETANILNNTTPRSLIILDEIGRGTSTFDGISIAWAVAEYLSTTPEVRARTLFATHYHELTELENHIEGVVNYNIAVKEWNDQIIFLRKIVQGGTDKSYGIHVARLAGLPRRVINRAMEILSDLENDSIREQHHQPLGTVKTDQYHGPQEEQLMLFGSQKPNPAVERLKKLTCDNLTPLEALNLLYELKELSKDNG